MADTYKQKRTLLDITVGSQGAKDLLSFNATMAAGGVNYATNNILTTTALNGAAVAEATELEISVPLSAGLTYEDLRENWPSPDGNDMSKYLDWTGRGEALMHPAVQKVYGGKSRKLALGVPLWRLCEAGKSRSVKNMALQSTTLKYSSFMGLNTYAISAITGAGSGGYRIRMKGYVYSASDLAYLQPGWQGSVSLETIGRYQQGSGFQNPVAFNVPNTFMTPDTWVQGPGGSNQGGIKVNLYEKFAFNALPTQTSNPYFLTNAGPAGASGNVENTREDLYFTGAAGTALLVQGFGITSITRPTNIVRAGFYVGGDLIPNNLNAPGAGFFLSDSTDDLYVGDIGPYAGLGVNPETGFSYVYEPLPRVQGEELLVAGKDFVPFIVANGAAIPALSIIASLRGVMIEGLAS